MGKRINIVLPETTVTIVAPITSTVRFPLNPVHVLLQAGNDTGLAVTSVRS
jgi:hypothetical protein